MNHDGNPFEPWRPPEEKTAETNSPRQADFAVDSEGNVRHLSTNPYVEQNVSIDQKQESPPLADGFRVERLLLFVGFAGIIVLAIMGYQKLPAGHDLRLLSSLGFLAVGLVLALAVARKQSWLVRLFLLLIALAAADACWWFVPTAKGLSLWTARQVSDKTVEELNALAACATVQFRQGQPARKDLLAQFPAFAPAIHEAEKAWRERSIVQWHVELKKLPAGKFADFENLRQAYLDFSETRLEKAELAWLERTYQRIAAGDFTQARRARAVVRAGESWSRKAQALEEIWAGRTVHAAIADAKRSLKEKPDKTSLHLQDVARDLAGLNSYVGLQKHLLGARRQAALAWLEAARGSGLALVKDNRFQDAAAAAQRLADQLGLEAKTVGIEDQVTTFSESYRFLADLDRQAGKTGK